MAPAADRGVGHRFADGEICPDAPNLTSAADDDHGLFAQEGASLAADDDHGLFAQEGASLTRRSFVFNSSTNCRNKLAHQKRRQPILRWQIGQFNPVPQDLTDASGAADPEQVRPTDEDLLFFHLVDLISVAGG